MGIMKNGPHGPVYGKVGNLVTYRVLNRDVVRMVGKINKAPSVKQLACRQQLAVVIQFLKPIVEFINLGFMVEAAKVERYAHNMAVSYNKRHGLMGEYPDVSVDYRKVLVAKGSLPMAVDAAVSTVPDGLRFSWATGSWMDFTERRHHAMLMAYFPDLGKAVYSLNGAARYEGTDVLYLPDDLKGAYMETYLSFTAVGSNEVADSVYLGIDFANKAAVGGMAEVEFGKLAQEKGTDVNCQNEKHHIAYQGAAVINSDDFFLKYSSQGIM